MGDFIFFLVVLLIMAIPWIVGLWLAIELIRWLRKRNK